MRTSNKLECGERNQAKVDAPENLSRENRAQRGDPTKCDGYPKQDRQLKHHRGRGVKRSRGQDGHPSFMEISFLLPQIVVGGEDK
jgi:hypothetical protein